MKQIRFFTLMCLAAVVAGLSCTKETPFPDSETAVRESMSLTLSVEAAALEIIENAFAGDAPVQARDLARDLGGIDGISGTQVYEEDDLIVLEQKDGIRINVFLDSFREEEEDDDLLENAALSVTSWNPSTRSDTEINHETAIVPSWSGKALLLAPRYSEDLDKFEKKWGAEGRVYGANLYREIENNLTRSGYQVDPYYDGDASIEKFFGKYMAKYAAVVIVSEGKKHAVVGPDNIHTMAIRSGEKALAWDESSLRTRFVTILSEVGVELWRYIFSRTSIGLIRGGLYYYFSAPMLEEDPARLWDAWLLAGADYSFSDNDLCKAFFASKGGGFTGFDDEMSRADLLSLSSRMVAQMCAGNGLAEATEQAKATARDIKGKAVKASKHLQSQTWPEADQFYLYNPTPYALSAHTEENSTVTLSWKVHPGIADRVFDVVVDDEVVQTVRFNPEQGQVHSAAYYPRRQGDHHWLVESRKIPGGIGPEAVFRSEPDTFYVESVVPLLITPSSVDFGTVRAGDPVEPRLVEIKNIGLRQLRVDSVTHGNDAFHVGRGTRTLLDPGDTLQLRVAFSPARLGEQSDEIVVKSGEETFTLTLTGTCVYDGALMSACDDWGNPLPLLELGNVEIGQEKTLSFCLQNVSPMTLLGKFGFSSAAFSTSLPSMFVDLFPEWFVRTSVTFRPSEEKDYSENLTVQFNGSLPEFILPVHGKGVPGGGLSSDGNVSLSPSSLEFHQVEIGNKSSLDIVVTNSGDLPVHILDVRCPDGYATGFYDGWTVAPHSSGTYPVFFLPTREMHYFGYVTLETDAGDSDLYLSVDGYGTKPSNPKGPSIMFDLSHLDFGDVKVGAARSRSVRVTNTGDTDLHVSSILASDWIQPDVGSFDLPAGETSTLSFRFSPPETVTYTGNIKLLSNSVNVVDNLSYSGRGVNRTVDVTSVSLDKTSLSMYRGEVARLHATVLPSNASDPWIIWISNDGSVASVDSDGKVTANRNGKAIITAYSPSGGKRATCEVIVLDSAGGNHERTGEQNWN